MFTATVLTLDLFLVSIVVPVTAGTFWTLGCCLGSKICSRW